MVLEKVLAWGRNEGGRLRDLFCLFLSFIMFYPPKGWSSKCAADC